MSKFIAAMDHSGGSTGGVLERYGQEYTEENKMELVHDMRLRMVNSPDFVNENIWAAILYRDTVERGMVSILKEKGIEAYLKVDAGCEDNGTLKDFDIAEMIEIAQWSGCTGTKMRSIVKDVEDMDRILTQQFALAEQIADAGLMPIVEPEIPIEHEDKELYEYKLRDMLAEKLSAFSSQCILKLTLPDNPDFYSSTMQSESVHMVVGLSGGYTTEEACRRLATQRGMSASFSRGLSEGLRIDQTDEEFNAHISRNIQAIKEAGK